MLLQQMPAPTSDQLTRVKDWASIAESFAKVAALFVAAIWTYLLFVRQRQRFPRAKIEHTLVQYPLPAGKVLLRLSVSIANIGNVLLQIAKTNVEIYRVRPWPEALENAILSGAPIQTHGPKQKPIDWPLIDAREITAPEASKEIEPSETENLYFDFVVETSLQKVFIWTYFENQAKRRRPVGWNTTSMHELRVAQTKDAHGSA
jgi:hypothetical protein